MRFAEGGSGGAFELAGIHVQAAGVTIENSLFYRSGAADGDGSRAIINSVGSGDGLTIADNAMTGWHTGAYVQGASNVTVSNNSFVDNFVGMSADAYAVGSADLNVTGNAFSNVLEDFGFAAVSASWSGDVSGNTFSKGIFDYDPADNAALFGTNTFIGPVTLTSASSSSVISFATIQAAIDAASGGRHGFRCEWRLYRERDAQERRQPRRARSEAEVDHHTGPWRRRRLIDC